MPSNRMTNFAITIQPDRYEKLKKLSEETRVPMAVYVREGIDMLLRRHNKLDTDCGPAK